MWLASLVFASDALITWLAARESLALQKLSWTAIWWDGLLTCAIAVNIVGFTKAGWLMGIPSVLGSMLGMTGAIWHGRRNGGVRSRASSRVEGFCHRGNSGVV